MRAPFATRCVRFESLGDIVQSWFETSFFLPIDPRISDVPPSDLSRIQDRIAPLRDALLSHPLYGRIDGLPGLRVFMEHHVFAVWDFMSLLKALQRAVTCVDVPWVPSAFPASARLINAIVLAEESDDDGRGGFASHFELYLRAMDECGADTRCIVDFVGRIREGSSVSEALRIAEVPKPSKAFVEATFAIIDSKNPAAMASAFAFGREDLLPDVFRKIVEELDAQTSGALQPFRYYLDRHIELDGDDHGPMAMNLVGALCGDNPIAWQAAEDAAAEALQARIALWDNLSQSVSEDLGMP